MTDILIVLQGVEFVLTVQDFGMEPEIRVHRARHSFHGYFAAQGSGDENGYPQCLTREKLDETPQQSHVGPLKCYLSRLSHAAALAAELECVSLV